MIIKTNEAKNKDSVVILPGQLAPQLDYLYTNNVTEIFQDYYLPSLYDLIKMFRFCPINRVSVEFTAMRAINLFGRYSHPDKQTVRTPSGRQTLTNWVLSNFQTMRGNLADLQAKMFRQASGFGYSVAEIIYSANITGHQGEWRIAKINVLNPTRYNFAGAYGEWDRIIFRSRRVAQFPIPRRKLIHIVLPSIDDPENPLGDGQGVRGYSYYLARKLALKNWNNQLAKGVKGQIVVKADSNKTVPQTDIYGKIVYDDDGNPVPVSAVKAAGKAVSQAKDGDVLALDEETEVQHLPGISGTGQDYNLALQRYTDDIFLGYGIPKTIFQEGSGALGQAGLNAGHNAVINSQITGMVQIAREQFIEQVIQGLLEANFGIQHQDDYGEFKPDTYLPPEQASVRISNLMSAMLQGVVSPTELEAVNRIREDSGLSRLSPEQFQQMQMEQIIQQQQQQASYATAA